MEDQTLVASAETVAYLTLVERLYGDYSRDFLRDCGLSAGMNVADVGCGIGYLLDWLADTVGVNGSVLGVDNSFEALEIARNTIRINKLQQVELIESSIFDLQEYAGQFDVVYSRFLLAELPLVGEAMSALLALVKPDGKLICEECVLTGCQATPTIAAVPQATLLLTELARLSGFDSDIGKHLATLPTEDRATVEWVRESSPVAKDVESKRLLETTLLAHAATIIEHGLANPNDIATLVEKLKQYAHQPNTVIQYYPLIQVCWQKL